MKKHLRREIYYLWKETELPWSINTIGNIMEILYGMIRHIEDHVGTNPENNEEKDKGDYFNDDDIF